jgi:hypothetical protein
MPLRYLLRALPLWVALLLYGYSVRLPFFIDDGLHFAMIKDYPVADGVPLLRFWGGAISFPYYRPAVFTVWEVEQALVGGHFDPFALHLLNVFFFGLAGVALGRLTARITRRELAGSIAGLTFVLFPFSYAAVILVAALFHMMLALFSTLTLLFALAWLDKQRMFSLVLCWLCAFVAVFTHENGVLIFPLLALLMVIVYGMKSLFTRRALILLAPLVVMIGVYLYLWATVPRASGTPEIMPTVFVSLGIMLQGLVYPFVALVRALTCAAGTCAQGDTSLLWGIAIVSVGVMLVSVYIADKRGRNMLRPYKIVIYGLVWYILGALPSALLLAPDYISGSPRLMMFSSLGAGIFWGTALATVWGSHRTAVNFRNFSAFAVVPNAASWRFKIVFVFLVSFAIFVSMRFLNERRSEALAQSDYTWQLLRLLERDQPTAPLLINAPAFLAPIEANRTFLTGAEGVVFMEEYVYYDQQFWAMTGIEFARPAALAHNPTQRSPSEIIYTPYQTVGIGTFNERLHLADAIYATEFDGARFYPVYVGAPNLSGADEPIAIFTDGGLALTEASATYSAETQTVIVMTRWRVDAPMPIKPFVHVVCDGQLVGQLDGAVWGGTYPFSQWTAGEIQTDVRPIRLSQPVTLECLRVYAGTYGENDGVRLEAVDSTTGERYPDDLVPIAIEP